ncbi:MAG: hypothetical protein GXO47_07075 [Chlorobi bacterium]|nr:hypothetical protein [Chlorobiota bacterium]
MKKLFIIVAALSILAVSCEVLDELTQFDMSYDSTFTVDSAIPINVPFDISTPPVQTNSESTFEGYNTAKNLIDEITLKKMKLIITAPEGENFDFLSNLELYINADGLDEELIASIDNIPEGQTELLLDVENTNIKDFIYADEFQLRVKTTTDEILTQDIEIKAEYVFHVNAKILGI